jgi:transposase InsO family protein
VPRAMVVTAIARRPTSVRQPEVRFSDGYSQHQVAGKTGLVNGEGGERNFRHWAFCDIGRHKRAAPKATFILAEVALIMGPSTACSLIPKADPKPSAPSRVWNRIPTAIHDQIIELALEQSELSPRELAVRFTDEKRYFVSEATVYRLLKAHDLITSPAYVVVKAANEFHTKTTRPNEMWQTDFTYLKIIGWGCLSFGMMPRIMRRLRYLSTVLDARLWDDPPDHPSPALSRYIIAWKLCTNMRAEDVTATLDMALAASGCSSATVQHKPRLLTDNGPSYIAGELAEYIEAQKMSHVRGAPLHPQTQGKIERWHQTLKNTRFSPVPRTGCAASPCWKTTSCPVTLRPRSKPSSSITTISVTMRA